MFLLLREMLRQGTRHLQTCSIIAAGGLPRRRRYLPRVLEPVLHKAATQFPAVVLTGPRHPGKTTLLPHVFGKTSGYGALSPIANP